MRFYKPLLLLVTICGFCLLSKAQIINSDSFPEVGKPCPDFLLKDIVDYPKKSVSLKDLKGKWIILDFWSRYCSSCIASFPKMNKLKRSYLNKVDLIMVCYDDDNWPEAIKIRQLYSKIKLKLQLDFPVAFDSLLQKKFGIKGVPHILVIDDKGIVRARTYTLDSLNVSDLIAGKNIILPKGLNVKEEENAIARYDKSKPLLINHNGGNDTDFIFRSLLASFNPNLSHPSFRPVMPAEWYYGNRLEVIGIPLISLYNYAYGDAGDYEPVPNSVYGKFDYKHPILETADSLNFKIDLATGKGMFNYSLIVPPQKGNREFIRQVMQRDLMNYFGYEVKYEKRLHPCWKLISVGNAKEKLKTKGAMSTGKGDGITGTILTNIPVNFLIILLWGKFQNDPPFIDETEIDGNIDITLDGMLTDFNDFKKALQKNGLELVKGEKVMKVLVIRDPKKE